MANSTGKPLDFGFYDSRFNPTFEVTEGYKIWSLIYDNMNHLIDKDLLENSTYLKNAIKNKHILDLGCGTGRTGAWLKKHGPGSLTGVDMTKEMLVLAEQKKIYDELIQSDIDGIDLGNRSFDGIISALVFCHIPNLENAFNIIYKLLNKNGWFALIDYHPFFLLRGISTHFSSQDKKDVAIKNYIHSFSQIFEIAKYNQLKLIEFKERFVTEDIMEQEPSFKKYKGQPVSYLMVFEKKE